VEVGSPLQVVASVVFIEFYYKLLFRLAVSGKGVFCWEVSVAWVWETSLGVGG